MPETVAARARLRERNQLTIPDSVVRASGLEPGEVLVVEVETSDPATLKLRRVRRSYAGAAHGLYGDPREYLERERTSWE